MTPVRVTLDGDIILDLTLDNSSLGPNVSVAGVSVPSFGQRKVHDAPAPARRRVEPARGAAARGRAQVADRVSGRDSRADPEAALLGQRHQHRADRYRDAADAAHHPDQRDHRAGLEADLHRVGAESGPRGSAAAHRRRARARRDAAAGRGRRRSGAARRGRHAWSGRYPARAAARLDAGARDRCGSAAAAARVPAATGRRRGAADRRAVRRGATHRRRRRRAATTPPAPAPVEPPITTPGVGLAQVILVAAGHDVPSRRGTVHGTDLDRERLAPLDGLADADLRSRAAARAKRSGRKLHAIGGRERDLHPADRAWARGHHHHARGRCDRRVRHRPARAPCCFDAVAPGNATLTLSGAGSGPGGTAMGLQFRPVTLTIQP